MNITNVFPRTSKQGLACLVVSVTPARPRQSVRTRASTASGVAAAAFFAFVAGAGSSAAVFGARVFGTRVFGTRVFGASER
jgi:hypothetical protein